MGKDNKLQYAPGLHEQSIQVKHISGSKVKATEHWQWCGTLKVRPALRLRIKRCDSLGQGRR